MNVIATIQVDLDTTALGTKSRLAETLAGTTILRRTVEHVSAAKNINRTYVLCPAAQRERCVALLDGTGAAVHSFDAPPPTWQSLVRIARKWSLDAWRGGIGGSTSFDEYTDPRLIAGLLEKVEADAVVNIPAAAPLFDPAVADRMIEHHRDNSDASFLTFTQAPPGLTGVVLRTSLVREIATSGIPVGWVLSYKPDSPQKDLYLQDCCYEVPSELRYATGRLIVDTERALRTVSDILTDHPDPDASTVGRWLIERERSAVEPFPREVEIELTTDDPYPSTLLRPRGPRVPKRGPIDPAMVQRIVEELVAHDDDALVVLGGFGDPLRHPQFAEILERIRSVRHDARGLFGLAVRTAAVDLNDDHIDALVANRVDVLDVMLDAWTPELYARLQSPDDPSAADLSAVLRRLDRLAQHSRQRESPAPVVVPEMTKTSDNVHELDDFHDGWLRRQGAVSITGYSHCGGQCEDRSVINMAPSPREACRRIRSRCLVLADGRVTTCDQDFRGLHTVGSLAEQTLGVIWRGAVLNRIRDAHREGRFDPTPLCAACDEWHRP